MSTPGHGQGEGSAGDKFRVSGTQETVEGAGVSEANGVLRNPYHPPGVTIYIEKRLTNHSVAGGISCKTSSRLIGPTVA